MKSLEIRQRFFDYFKKHNHHIVASSSLIPAQDPTLLFTNAGMNQFKDYFLGNEKPTFTQAVTIQKCIRAGGKHNDLDNVGFTKRHLTFFEMMGNFSFGDYFKKQAIPLAWNFVTQDLGIDKNKLYVTIYKEDDESFAIWHNDVGIAQERIYRFDKQDNFWQMGDTGPCGPCTEIFVDLREPHKRQELPTQEDFDTGRLLEIWNLVFMQYDRQIDGKLVPLKQTGVDTGMGLERVTSVLQNVDSVYQSDLFTPLIQALEKITELDYQKQPDALKAAFHVLADHARSSSLIIADGCSPSNEGRGYVLRKIIRRAALFAQKLSEKNIFPQLAQVFINYMSPIYPELATNQTQIISLLTHEIEQFTHNLVRGQHILAQFFEAQKEHKIITGEQAFKLYDTYGFPLEVTVLASQEQGYTVDQANFHIYMEEQRKLSGKKMKHATQELVLPETIRANFVGYEKTNVDSPVVALLVDNTFMTEVDEAQECWVITKECPFFPTTGGQVDDQGWIEIKNNKAAIRELKKLHSSNHEIVIAYKIVAPAAIILDDIITQQVDGQTRKMTMNNHTATHLLQAALIELLGKQVKQSGSVVDPDYLRFDFTYHKNLTPDEITWVENRVNEKIREDIPVAIFETTYKQALDRGVIAIFGEKYNPEKVRVIDVPGFSAELCGGTHVPSTGVIGAFKITDVGALSAGNRRIFAVTGIRALELMQHNFNTIKLLSQEFKVKPEEVLTTVLKQTELARELQTEVRELKKQLMRTQLPLWKQSIEKITTSTNTQIPFLYIHYDGSSVNELKELVDDLQVHEPGFYVAVSNSNDTAVFFMSVAPVYEHAVDLTALNQWLQKTFNLRGGGKKNTLQGSGPKITKNLGELIKTGLAK